MTEPVIKCPNCGSEIRLSDSVIAPFLDSTRRDFDDRLKRETNRISEEEAARSKKALEADMQRRADELADLNRRIIEKDEKLAQAQKEQAEALKLRTALEEQKRELDLVVQKGIREGLDSAREKAKKEAEDLLGLKVVEKETIIASMQKQIEDLKRKSEQGSQQLQGEAQELQLESILAMTFPGDCISPVPKGEFGGDVTQTVHGAAGQICGSILWESKRTRSWSDGWLEKLRADQRTARADAAIIVTQVLPSQVETFGLVDGVWVSSPAYAVPLAAALRHMLVEVALTRQAAEGQETKMEMVYAYLTGQPFRQRVQAIVEAFTTMRQELEKEKKALTAHWAKREKQLERVLAATTGMYGDLQGIAGGSVIEIEALEMKALGDGSEDQDVAGQA